MSYDTETIKNFAFDLYQATRRSLIASEVQKLYDVDFREISDKYFSQCVWPNANTIITECSGDEVFLLFYK